MPDLRDGPQSALSAIRDVLMKNQDLKQQDLEAKYGHYGKQPEPEQAAEPEPDVVEPEVDNVVDDSVEVETPDEPRE